MIAANRITASPPGRRASPVLPTTATSGSML